MIIEITDFGDKISYKYEISDDIPVIGDWITDGEEIIHWNCPLKEVDSMWREIIITGKKILSTNNPFDNRQGIPKLKE